MEYRKDYRRDCFKIDEGRSRAETGIYFNSISLGNPEDNASTRCCHPRQAIRSGSTKGPCGCDERLAWFAHELTSARQQLSIFGTENVRERYTRALMHSKAATPIVSPNLKATLSPMM